MSSERSRPRSPVRALCGLWLAGCLFGAREGTKMIKTRVRVINEDGGFTILVCAESLREVEQIARARYPRSAVEIAFPIEPEGFFADGYQSGVHTNLETRPAELTNPMRLS
jgi:hypothetical protein